MTVIATVMEVDMDPIAVLLVPIILEVDPTEVPMVLDLGNEDTIAIEMDLHLPMPCLQGIITIIHLLERTIAIVILTGIDLEGDVPPFQIVRQDDVVERVVEVVKVAAVVSHAVGVVLDLVVVLDPVVTVDPPPGVQVLVAVDLVVVLVLDPTAVDPGVEVSA